MGHGWFVGVNMPQPMGKRSPKILWLPRMAARSQSPHVSLAFYTSPWTRKLWIAPLGEKKVNKNITKANDLAEMAKKKLAEHRPILNWPLSLVVWNLDPLDENYHGLRGTPWELAKQSMESLRKGFPQMEVPQNIGFIRETPSKMDDLGVPLFQETTIKISLTKIVNGLVLLEKSSPGNRMALPSNWSGFPVSIFPSSNSMN